MEGEDFIVRELRSVWTLIDDGTEKEAIVTHMGKPMINRIVRKCIVLEQSGSNEYSRFER